MPDLNLNEDRWRGKGILAGEDDPAGEVARTEQQGFGRESGSPDPADEARPRGPGRPRNPPSDKPKERTKSVRVELPLPVYGEVKMMSWKLGIPPGKIIAELVAEHLVQPDASAGWKAGGE